MYATFKTIKFGRFELNASSRYKRVIKAEPPHIKKVLSWPLDYEARLIRTFIMHTVQL